MFNLPDGGSDDLSDTFAVSVTDNGENLTVSPVFTVVKDTTAPTATITVPAASGLAIPVSWAGDDFSDGSGIRSYDVAYKEEGGSWTGWYTATTATQATLIGTEGVSYTFRIKATGFWILDLRFTIGNTKGTKVTNLRLEIFKIIRCRFVHSRHW